MSSVLAEPEPVAQPASAASARLILVTGIMASGKSTVAERLAEHFPKSVHLRGDVFRRMIKGGRLELTRNPSAAALEQLRLRYRLAAAAADGYCEAGFTVIYQDVVIGPDLKDVLGLLKTRPLHLVVLCPSPEVVEKREAARSKRGYGGWSVPELDWVLRTETPRLGLWLDTSHLTVDETVDIILAKLPQAAVNQP